MVTLMPFPVMLSRRLQVVAKAVSKLTDDRVETVTESACLVSLFTVNVAYYLSSDECD